MPRGPVVYSLVPGTVPQQPNTTIQSAMFNAAMTDIENAFNTPQPIEYGGTNATTAAGARTNLGVSSAAVSAMDARRNLFVNSNFAQSQERGDVVGTSNGYFPADQIALFYNAATATMAVRCVQLRSLANSINQIAFSTATAKAVLGANDFVTLTQPIEGSSMAEAGWGTAAAMPIVVRFQVRLPAGTYHVHVSNSAANRNVSVPFIVSGGEANAAVVKTVSIPGDTTGTWLTADGVIGANFDIVLAAGSALTGGTAGVWGASYLIASTTQANILSSTANVVRLADIGAKVDPDATGVYGAWKADVDAVYRSERYIFKTYAPSTPISPTSVGALLATGVTGVNYSTLPVSFPVRLAKSSPIFTVINPTTAVSGQVDVDGVGVAAIAIGSERGATIRVNNVATANNQFIAGHLFANARLT